MEDQDRTIAEDEFFMRRAIALSEMALADQGLKPYGAVVVRRGVIIGEGINRSVERSDPTSHGEIEAIRAACAALGTLDLSDCTLYTSSEPCPMCRATTMMAGISRVVYGASIADGAEVYKANPGAPRAMPMPAEEMRVRVGAPIGESGLAARRSLRGEAMKVLNDFAARRTPR